MVFFEVKNTRSTIGTLFEQYSCQTHPSIFSNGFTYRKRPETASEGFEEGNPPPRKFSDYPCHGARIRKRSLPRSSVGCPAVANGLSP